MKKIFKYILIGMTCCILLGCSNEEHVDSMNNDLYNYFDANHVELLPNSKISFVQILKEQCRKANLDYIIQDTSPSIDHLLDDSIGEAHMTNYEENIVMKYNTDKVLFSEILRDAINSGVVIYLEDLEDRVILRCISGKNVYIEFAADESK